MRRALAPEDEAGGAPALKEGIPPKLGAAVLVGWGFKKPLDCAGAWNEELKPPGFVFSLVFPNENAGAVAGLVG